MPDMYAIGFGQTVLPALVAAWISKSLVMTTVGTLNGKTSGSSWPDRCLVKAQNDPVSPNFSRGIGYQY
jgi:hypothetical protein